MDAKELRSLTKEELNEKLDSLNKELYGLNSKRKYGKVDKPHLFSRIKKERARVLTILNEPER